MAGGDQAEVAGEGTLAVEAFRVLHLAEQVHGRQHPDAWDGEQEFHTGSIRFGTGQLSYPAGDGQQVGAQPVDLRQQQIQRLPGGRQQTHVFTQPTHEPEGPVRAGPGEALREETPLLCRRCLTRDL
ncbi:MAG: hypothetical protein ACI37U_02920 [Bacteroides sp.]